MFADAIYENRNNPTTEGRYYPAKGSSAWRQGCGAMANDCLNAGQYNAMMKFNKPHGKNKALCELAVKICKIVATRDIGRGEEVRVECVSSVLRVVLSLASPPDQHRTQLDAHHIFRILCSSVGVFQVRLG